MITIQLVGVIIGLSAIYITHLYYKRANFSKKELFFWMTIWVGFVFIAIFPESTNPITGYLRLQRPMDLIMIVAFMILFGLSFHNYIITKKQTNKLERLVRELALKDLEELEK